MIGIFLKILCFLILSLGGVTVSFGQQNCNENPRNCTKDNLCFYAYSLRGGKAILDFNVFPEHAREAQRRGLTARIKRTYLTCSYQSSPLKSAFIKLDKERRVLIQTNLKGIGFYKSSIDGLYGKRTENALIEFNKRHLENLSVKKTTDILKIFDAIYQIKVSQSPSQNNNYQKL